jgi:hypothetical protein
MIDWIDVGVIVLFIILFGFLLSLPMCVLGMIC